VTAPPTEVAPGPVRVKIAAVIVAGFIASSKAAVIAVLNATPVALLRGVTAVTVGGVVLATEPVVKLQTKLLASAAPSTVVTPVVIVAVKVEFTARSADGVNVTVALEQASVPATTAPVGPFTIKVDAVTVEQLTA
jgi:hypothetical protein